jgi:hypothetical protein
MAATTDDAVDEKSEIMLKCCYCGEMSDSLIENVSMPEGYTRTSVALRIASTLKCNDYIPILFKNLHRR